MVKLCVLNRLDLRESQNDFNVKSNFNDVLEPMESHKSAEFPVAQSPLQSPRLSKDNVKSRVVPNIEHNLKSSPEPTRQTTYITRSGRTTKPVQKLNL